MKPAQLDIIKLRRTPAGREAIYHRYHGLVINQLRALLTTGISRTLEDDLKSAGATGLMHAVSTYRPVRGVKFITYATNKVRWAMLDVVRKEKKRYRNAKISMHPNNHGPSSPWIQADYLDLADGLNDLKPRDRRIVKLHYFQGVQVSTIADHMDVTQGRVSQILRGALTQLRDSLTRGIT